MTPVEAIERNLYAFPPFHAWSRAEGHDGPDLLWTSSEIPTPYFNRVGRANLREDEADAAIAAAIARARAKNASLMWWVGPSTRPADLAQRLEAHGFQQTIEYPGMAMELEAEPTVPPVPGLRIERVRDLAMLRVWNDLGGFPEERYSFFAEHFDPSFHHYLGYMDGVPMSTSTLFLGGGVAGIYSVFTREDLRGRGIGAALTYVGLHDAYALGHRQAVLAARPKSAVLYARLGFVEHCRFSIYVREG